MNWVEELNRLWTPTPGRRVKTMSDEWKQARRGRLTASSRARSIAGPRAVSNFPILRDKILAELRPDYEWIEQQFAATRWGNEHERQALSNLELALGLEDIESYEPGFLLHPTRSYAGATPDLLIDEREVRGGELCVETTAVQVKCPHDPEVHKKTWAAKKVLDDQYWYQLQWEAWVTSADRAMFCSYDPRPRRSELQLVHFEVEIDRDLQKIFAERCDLFHGFIEGRVALSRPVDVHSLASQF